MKKIKLKQCQINKSHTWIANIEYCPYCNFTVNERVNYLRNKKKEKEVAK